VLLIRLGRGTAAACALLSLSCRTPHTPATPVRADAAQAVAIIGTRHARFVFPEEMSDSITWPPPTAQLRIWEVSWQAGPTTDPSAPPPELLRLLLRWHREPARTWPLRELVAQFPPRVLTYICVTCRMPAPTRSVPSDDPAVKAHADGRRIVFTIEGRDAIRRIFPVVPESVTFRRLARGEAGNRVVRSAVEHREP